MVIVMTNTDFRVFWGYLMSKFSKRNHFSQVCDSRRKTSLWRHRSGGVDPWLLYTKPHRTSLNNGQRIC